MPYRNQSPFEVAKQMDELQKELDHARKTLLAVRLVLVVAACLIAIQIISNCMLVRLAEPSQPVPVEKPP